MPTATAKAVWEGGMRTGKGNFESQTGLAAPYTFATRFEDRPGANPEELLAAAHAACFSMAFSGALERAGNPPARIETFAACTVEKGADGFRITTMKLTTRASVPGMDKETFEKVAQEAKANCPVSQALKNNVRIELEAQLV